MLKKIETSIATFTVIDWSAFETDRTDVVCYIDLDMDKLRKSITVIRSQPCIEEGICVSSSLTVGSRELVSVLATVNPRNFTKEIEKSYETALRYWKGFSQSLNNHLRSPVSIERDKEQAIGRLVLETSRLDDNHWIDAYLVKIREFTELVNNGFLSEMRQILFSSDAWKDDVKVQQALEQIKVAERIVEQKKSAYRSVLGLLASEYLSNIELPTEIKEILGNDIETDTAFQNDMFGRPVWRK